MAQDSEEYVTVQPLGSGSYGEVFMAKGTKSNLLVAIKRIRPDEDDSGVQCSELREISILKELQGHPNIVQLQGVVHSNDGPLDLVFELLDMDLRTYIYAPGRVITDEVVRIFMKQLCAGMEYCHSLGILHRDLKPRNLLIGAGNLLKIADFGLARHYDPWLRKYSGFVVTRSYRAPEISLGGIYGTAADVWSIGCIFAEMRNKKVLFCSKSDPEHIVEIFKKLGTPDEDKWPGVSQYPNYGFSSRKWEGIPVRELCPSLDEAGQDLLEMMLIYDPEQRISTRRSLEKPYLAPDIKQ